MTTSQFDVVHESTVLNVLAKAGKPVPTIDITFLLADEYPIESPDDVSMPRLRRTLDRLEEEGAVVASGGPKRDVLPGWGSGDRRDVLWATSHVADRIAEEVAEAERQRVEEMERRTHLLKELHKRCRPEQRDALGITGLFSALKADPQYANGHGATTWDLPVLEAVCDLVGID